MDVFGVNTSYLGYGHNDEGATSGALGHDGQELGVNGAEVVVMDVLGDGNTIKAVFPIGHLAVDVSKLGASVGRAP